MNQAGIHRFPFYYRLIEDGPNGRTISQVNNDPIERSWSRVGTKNPNYKYQIANLQDATTAFSATNGWFFRMDPIVLSASVFNPFGGGVLTTTLDGYLTPADDTDTSSINPSVAIQQARRKLINEVKKRRTAFEGGKFLIEIKDTIRMIKHPLRGLREGLNTYHQTVKKRLGKVRVAKLQNRIISDTWLEYQFGWQPLSSDIDEALANLRDLSKPRAVRFAVSGVDRIVSKTRDQTGRGGSTNHFYVETRDARSTVTYRGAYKVKPPTSWDWNSWGLSTQDFLPSIWEGIPWSFAVDYFANVGQIIDAYSFLYADISWVNRTIRKQLYILKQGVEFNISGLVASSNILLYKNETALGSTGVALKSVQRETISIDELIPRLTLSVPGAGSVRWLNLTALAHLRTF